MFEFCEKIIHGFEASWIQGNQIVLKLIDPKIILFVKQGREMIPNLLRSVQSQDVERNIWRLSSIQEGSTGSQ